MVKEANHQSGQQGVVGLLSMYFDALYESDDVKMGAIFHPRGVYATADEVPMLTRDRSTYLEVLREREAPQARGEERKDHVDTVELAGANTARAKVRCSIGSRDFVDYLTLVRDDGRWQIISKVFQILDSNEEEPKCRT